MYSEREREYPVKSGISGTVFILAAILGLAQAGAGCTVSVGVPLTDANITSGAAAGHPEVIDKTLPDYVKNHINNPDGGYNFSQRMHWSFIGEQSVTIVGHQDGAPVIDLHINFKRR